MDLKEVNARISDRSECFYWQTDRKVSAEEAAMIWKDRHAAITNEELLTNINSILKDDKLVDIKPFDEKAQTSLGSVNSIRVGVLKSGKEVIIRCHPKGVQNGYFHAESLAASIALENGIPAYKTYVIHDLEKEDDISYQVIEKLNGDTKVDGILCQLPLPRHIDEKTVINSIAPEKDVDAFHPVNTGHIMIGDHSFLPCTPAGIIEMLKYYNIQISGKECVVIGRSNIVGKPMAMLLLQNSGTVTICHSKTENLSDVTRRADILVAAVGKANFVTADMVKDGAVVIDVGMNRNEEGKLCGDMDFPNVKDKCSYITPVPGGVGPMTITMLLNNTLTASKNNMKK